jgi:hypothetical protein
MRQEAAVTAAFRRISMKSTLCVGEIRFADEIFAKGKCEIFCVAKCFGGFSPLGENHLN